MKAWWGSLTPQEKAVVLAAASVFQFVAATWWLGMYQDHAACIEALKDPGVGDVIRSQLCR